MPNCNYQSISHFSTFFVGAAFGAGFILWMVKRHPRIVYTRNGALAKRVASVTPYFPFKGDTFVLISKLNSIQSQGLKSFMISEGS